MIRILLGICAALLAAAIGLGLVARQATKSAQEARSNSKVMATQLEGAESALRAYERNAAVERGLHAKRLAEANRARAKGAERTQEIEHAKETTRDWAATPVPDSVWDAIAPAAPSIPASSTR